MFFIYFLFSFLIIFLRSVKLTTWEVGALWNGCISAAWMHLCIPMMKWFPAAAPVISLDALVHPGRIWWWNGFLPRLLLSLQYRFFLLFLLIWRLSWVKSIGPSLSLEADCCSFCRIIWCVWVWEDWEQRIEVWVGGCFRGTAGGMFVCYWVD